MSIQAYLHAISVRYKTGISREHAYRGDLQSLLMGMLPDILVTNEPARVACGAPDYVLTRKDIPIGYIEAKDIGVDLNSKTFRGMRWKLLKTYDKIYTIDLHGNSKKKEIAPDGSPDQNVFDIMQGVSINLFVKTGLKVEKELSKVYQYDLYGKRSFKYSFLAKNNLENINFVEVKPFAPNYTFKNLDLEKINLYNKGFSLMKLFPVNVGGFTTHRDNFAIDFDKDKVVKRATDMKDIRVSDEEIYQKYNQ